MRKNERRFTILPHIYHITMAIINDLISTDGYFISRCCRLFYIVELYYIEGRCMKNQFSHRMVLKYMARVCMCVFIEWLSSWGEVEARVKVVIISCFGHHYRWTTQIDGKPKNSIAFNYAQAKRIVAMTDTPHAYNIAECWSRPSWKIWIIKLSSVCVLYACCCCDTVWHIK